MMWRKQLVWRIEFEQAARKELTKLDQQSAKRILAYLRERIAVLDNPRSLGHALKGSELGDFWRYRVGDYRIVANIEDSTVRILVLRVGNRRSIYR
jgi:mRNA interferase RelE/StbE